MRKLSLVLIIVLTLLTSTAAATTFHADNARTGNFTSEKIIPVIAWKANITGLVDSSPIYSNGYVFVTNWYGWKSWQPGLYCINANDGSIVWRNENITGASSVVVFKGKLVVGSLSGKLFFVNISTGKIEKSLKLENSPSWWGIASSPLYYNGSIYVTTFSNGTLWKIDENGNVVAHFTTGGQISHYTSPAEYNGKIFFAGNDSSNKLYCLDENLKEIWNFSVSSEIMNTPSIGYGKVFFATKDRLYALNLNGSEAWNVSFNGTISSAAIAYGNIYIGSSDGYLYCFNATNGNVVWKFKANGKIDSSPAVANGVVYFATNTPEGTIYALDASNGKLLWFYRLIPPSGSYYNIMSSPFLADNKLFIGADNGYVYCFNSSGEIDFKVKLSPTNETINVNGKNYEIRQDTALGALLEASSYTNDSAEIYFNVTLDDSWYQKYGSFFISSIMGFGTKNVNGKWIYWSIWNDTSPLSVGANLYFVRNGESINYCYGDGSSLDSCSILLKIKCNVTPAGVSNLTVTSARLAGNATAFVNIGSSKSGWFVVVVSGLNDKGDYIAGISTVYLKQGESLDVPVLIHVPQRNTVGTYKLYAGVYEFKDYPNKILAIYGPVDCKVVS